jgi:hypothetical protein
MFRWLMLIVVVCMGLPAAAQNVPVLSQSVGLTTGTLVLGVGEAVSFPVQAGLMELRVFSNDPATTPAVVSVKLTPVEPVGDFLTLENPGETGPMIEGGSAMRFRLWSRGWVTVRGASGTARVGAWVVE